MGNPLERVSENFLFMNYFDNKWYIKFPSPDYISTGSIDQYDNTLENTKYKSSVSKACWDSGQDEVTKKPCTKLPFRLFGPNIS